MVGFAILASTLRGTVITSRTEVESTNFYSLPCLLADIRLPCRYEREPIINKRSKIKKLSSAWLFFAFLVRSLLLYFLYMQATNALVVMHVSISELVVGCHPLQSLLL